MPRFHGRVKTFFMDRGHGFITELAETGSLEDTNVVTTCDVYFDARDLRVANPRSILRKATTGDIVEYERVGPDDRGRYQAKDITGLYQTRLPCEEGLVVFKRWYDIQREALRREGSRAVHNYLAGNMRPQKRGRGRGRGGGSSYSHHPETREQYTDQYPDHRRQDEPRASSPGPGEEGSDDNLEFE